MSAWVRSLSDRSWYRPTPVGFSSSVALRPTICGLLYRLLIICAHLQRHSAIGYLLPLADLMLSAPSIRRPAPFDREAHVASPFLSILLVLLKPHARSFPLFFSRPSACISHRGPLQLSGESHRPLGIFPCPRVRPSTIARLKNKTKKKASSRRNCYPVQLQPG